MRRLPASLAIVLLLAVSPLAYASGGPFGIDHRVAKDDSGIWKRSNQRVLLYGTLFTVGIGALAKGDNDPLGDTFWRSVDSIVVTTGTVTVMKHVFRRERPRETNDPDRWFKSGGRSFPSGQVSTITAAVTPFILNYGEEHPMVYALALLPAYDAIARVKVQGHWQSDVLAGAAVGFGIGWWSSRRAESPFVLSLLPGGFRVGFVHHFR